METGKHTGKGNGLTKPAIRVRLIGSHRSLPSGGDTAEVPCIPGETIKDFLRRMAISDHEVWMVVVNHRVVSDCYVPVPGDTVEVMSPVVGG